MPTSNVDRLLYRSSRTSSSARAGYSFGQLWSKNKPGQSLESIVELTTTLRLASYFSHPDYSLAFVCGYNPDFVNMLTRRVMIHLGFHPSVLDAYGWRENSH